jgi:Tfp pilus assembly protein PilF
MALLYLTRQDYQNAEQVVKKAQAAAPQSADAAVVLAQFYMLTGRLGEAEAGFKKQAGVGLPFMRLGPFS